MTKEPKITDSQLFQLLPFPSWIHSGRSASEEDTAFLSGTALGHLNAILNTPEAPLQLLRQRLALQAAERCMSNSGRPERAGELRDEIHFLRAGDRPGPGGEIYFRWQRSVERGVSVRALTRALPDCDATQIGEWIDAGRGTPICRAASVLESVLVDRPRDLAVALIMAEAALAQAMRWPFILPLLSLNLSSLELRKTGCDLRLSCYRSLLKSTPSVVATASDLFRRAQNLREVVPKLRAKGAVEAAELFLTQDAVAPSAMSSLRSDRAARRFCDRLVDLGAARELTGRDTFRLYGV